MSCCFLSSSSCSSPLLSERRKELVSCAHSTAFEHMLPRRAAQAAHVDVDLWAFLSFYSTRGRWFGRREFVNNFLCLYRRSWTWLGMGYRNCRLVSPDHTSAPSDVVQVRNGSMARAHWGDAVDGNREQALKTLLKLVHKGFPGGAVVKNLPANTGDTGSSPGPGRSHMPRSN